MRNRQRFGCLILLLFGMVAITLLMIVYRSLTGSLPRVRGRLEARGLIREVKVFRDGYSVPAIFAENTHDLVFSQGYVTAQDRLWQMDVARRAARGRLSEIFGRATLSTDSLMRTIGLGRGAEASASALPDASAGLLRAYSDGVNAFITSQRKRMPVETMLLDYAVEPWTPADCIAVLRLHLFESGSGWVSGPTAAAIKAAFPEFRKKAAAGRMPPPRIRLESPAVPEKWLLTLRNVLDESFIQKPSVGTLIFAVPGARMESGKSVFVHAPAGDLRIPSPWYQVLLRSDSIHASGLTLPGFPLVWAGHNDRTAWAPAPPDGADSAWLPVLLKEEGLGKIFFSSGKGWKSAEEINETIRMARDSTLTLRIAVTDRGPALLSTAASGTPAAAFAWNGHFDGTWDAVVDCLLRMNRAYNAAVFRTAAGELPAQAGVWLISDCDGAMGFQASAGPRGYVRTGDRMMALADQWISDGRAIRPVSSGTFPDDRIRRLTSLLALKDTLTGMDIRAVLTDDYSRIALRLRDRVLPFLRAAAGDSKADPLEAKALWIWAAWDGRMKSGGAAPALAELFFERLIDHGFRQRLGEAGYALFADLPAVHLPAVLDAVETWTAGDADRFAPLAAASFHETVAGLKEALGPDTTAWNWGVLNTLTFEHPLGGQKLLRRIFSAGPFPMAGSSTALACWEHPVRTPFRIRNGPTARLILYPGDWDGSVTVISTGQSGHPMDAAHYRDQLQLFLEDCYRPDLWDSEKISRSGSGLLVLAPGTAP